MSCIGSHPLPQNTHIQSLREWQLNLEHICVRSPPKHSIQQLNSESSSPKPLQHAAAPLQQMAFYNPPHRAQRVEAGIRPTPTESPVSSWFLPSWVHLLLQPLLSDYRLQQNTAHSQQCMLGRGLKETVALIFWCYYKRVCLSSPYRSCIETKQKCTCISVVHEGNKWSYLIVCLS